jgi:plastocyanin
MSIHFYTISTPKYQRAVVTFILLLTFIGSSPLNHYNALHAQVNTPPIFYQVMNLPSYVITIPFSSLGKSSFEPAEVNIPAGMTIIWFNDDIRKHSVTTLPSSPYLSHQTIDSGPIPPNGGSFVHTFSKVGVYDYNDKFNPSIQGRIVVGISMVPFMWNVPMVLNAS